MLDEMKRRLSHRRTGPKRKLRRQPRMRRMASGNRLGMLEVTVPKTARKRRRRNRTVLRLPTDAMKKVLLSSRWISLLLLVLCVVALLMVGMNERFYLTMIPVEGVGSISAEEIVEVSELGGAHIFSADPVEAADRVASIPGVISATVTLEWPNTATIRVQEDTPVAIWEQNGEIYWINAGGALTPARVDVPGLLHIRAADTIHSPETRGEATAEVEEEVASPASEEDAIEIAPAPFVPPEVLRGALQLRALRPNIHLLEYDISGGLSFQDGRGWRVYFGTGEDMAEKLAVYETLVEHLLAQQETPAYISVSNQEKPFYLARDS